MKGPLSWNLGQDQVPLTATGKVKWTREQEADYLGQLLLEDLNTTEGENHSDLRGGPSHTEEDAAPGVRESLQGAAVRGPCDNIVFIYFLEEAEKSPYRI